MMRGKVVLVPFPFDDLSAAKVRPAMCLTEAIGPQRHVVITFISTRVPLELLDTDLVIPSSHPDFKACGLHVASTVRLFRLPA